MIQNNPFCTLNTFDIFDIVLEFMIMDTLMLQQKCLIFSDCVVSDL